MIKKTLLVVLSSMAWLQAENVQVLPVQGANFSIDASATMQALVRSAVQKAGDTPVESEQPVQIRTSLMRLDQTYIVVTEKLQNGQVVQSNQLKAASADELDVVVERTVTASLKGSSARSNEEVGKITDEEEKSVQKRKESRNYKSFGLGPAGMHGMDNSGELAYMIHTGYIWEVGGYGAITLTNNVGMTFSELALHEALLIGGRLYVTPTAVSPYLGAGAGIGLTLGDALRVGFAVGGSAGLVLFRTSSTQLELGGDYDVIFDSRDGGHPVGMYGGHIAINY